MRGHCQILESVLEEAKLISEKKVNLEGIIVVRFEPKEMAKAYEYIEQVGSTMNVLLVINGRILE